MEGKHGGADRYNVIGIKGRPSERKGRKGNMVPRTVIVTHSRLREKKFITKKKTRPIQSLPLVRPRLVVVPSVHHCPARNGVPTVRSLNLVDLS